MNIRLPFSLLRNYVKSIGSLPDSKGYFKKYLDFLHAESLYPTIHEMTGFSYEPRVTVNGKTYLSFSSNNYLGLAGHKDIKQSVKDGVDRYGIGSGGTRLVSGTLDIQVEFERMLAHYLDCEDTITFSSGYLANVGVIRMLVDPFPYFSIFPEKLGVIISDELNHASIIDGVRLAKASRVVYKHSDMAELEALLKKYQDRRKLIITDGVFSMDGDLANLKVITQLAKKYDAVLMVDDSHAVGVLGPHGKGTAHLLGVEKDVDVIMGSFTKAFGNIGGFIGAKKNITEYLRITARSYIFSDPIPPALVAGLITTTKLIIEGDHLREKALRNSQILRSGLIEAGFTVYGTDTTIIPLIIGDERKAINFSKALTDNGIIATCVRRPVVLPGKERMRFSVMASHNEADVQELLRVCKKIGKELGIT